MFSMKDLSTEIESEIEALNANGPVLMHPDWITLAIVSRHRNISGNDCDFWTVTGTQAIRSKVGQRINAYKLQSSAEVDRQLVFAGFERLQTHYVVEDESGTSIAVPLDELSEAQCDAKEAEFVSMLSGLAQHLDEFRRWRATRRKQGAA